MVKLNLKKENFKYIEETVPEYDIIEITNKRMFSVYGPKIQHIIDQFNKEFVWDCMFDLKEVENRVNTGISLYLLFKGTTPIGYCFIKDHILFNFYVSRELPRNKFTPVYFCNKVIYDYIYIKERTNRLVVNCEEWNHWGQRIFLENNFKQDE